MKTIKNFEQFNESFNLDTDEKDIAYVLSELVKGASSSKEIYNLKDVLDKLSIGESVVNESLLDNIKNWANDKLFSFLINRKKSFYTKLVDKLDIFDLTTLDDTFENYPGFTKLDSMYMAGGMDEAEDTGKGWRLKLEDQFGEKNIIDGIDLDILLKNKSHLQNYDKPVLLNPVRKEVDRNKSNDFADSISALKSPKYNPKVDGDKPLQFFKKTFASSIEPDDEHLLRISDAVFLGQDRSAGAGTYGELELLSLVRKPLFCWLINKSSGLTGEIKLWTIPTLSKVMLNDDDMKTFVKTLKRYAK
ncbi:hypothetical protein M0Q50_10195 [bacterium]|jgi:hypothetical protein|nr:hypothetical protein [bacterium]